MSENKTNINDLSEGSSNQSELSEQEMASVSGGLRASLEDGSERLPTIETIHSDGRVTMDIK